MCCTPRGWGDILLGWGFVEEQVGAIVELFHRLAVLHLLCCNALQLLQWLGQFTSELHLPSTGIRALDGPPVHSPLECVVPLELLSD